MIPPDLGSRSERPDDGTPGVSEPARAPDLRRGRVQPPLVVARIAARLDFRPTAGVGTREASFRPTPPARSRRGGRRGATGRDAQAGVPSAGRLRAQLAFKDSMVHGILQFTPSIAFRYVLHRCESRDIRCRESLRLGIVARRGAARDPGQRAPIAFRFPWRVRRRGWLLPRSAGGRRERRRVFSQPVRGSFWTGIDNDPSAGSPTETLLRLLLPLNDKVQWTSRDVAGGEPPTSPRSEHFTGPFNR